LAESHRDISGLQLLLQYIRHYRVTDNTIATTVQHPRRRIAAMYKMLLRGKKHDCKLCTWHGSSGTVIAMYEQQ
jgi:hypothetical protein